MAQDIERPAIDADLHHELKKQAIVKNTSLREEAENAIEQYLQGDSGQQEEVDQEFDDVDTKTAVDASEVA